MKVHLSCENVVKLLAPTRNSRMWVHLICHFTSQLTRFVIEKNICTGHMQSWVVSWITICPVFNLSELFYSIAIHFVCVFAVELGDGPSAHPHHQSLMKPLIILSCFLPVVWASVCTTVALVTIVLSLSSHLALAAAEEDTGRDLMQQTWKRGEAISVAIDH